MLIAVYWALRFECTQEIGCYRYNARQIGGTHAANTFFFCKILMIHMLMCIICQRSEAAVGRVSKKKKRLQQNTWIGWTLKEERNSMWCDRYNRWLPMHRWLNYFLSSTDESTTHCDCEHPHVARPFSRTWIFGIRDQIKKNLYFL